MAFIIKDRVKEGTTSTGTGAITLGGAAATFDPFNSYMTNGDTTYYAIVHTTSGVDEWEVGIGTWNTGNTLTRTTVLAGSNGTSAVNFSAGTKDVFMTYPASKAVYTDASGDIDINGGTIDGTTIGATTADTGKFTTLETTSNADIGGYIDLEILSNHAAYKEGRIWYDSVHKTLNFYSDDSNVVHELGIEEHQRVYNNTGSTIPKGAPLYFSGNYTAGTIDVPTVGLADATDVNAYNAQGLAASDIADGSYGYCIVAGQLTEVDTSGLNAGTNFFVGLTPGAVQNSSPVYPNYPMCLGWVVNSHATEGVLLVNQQNHSVNSFRVRTDAHIGDDLIVGGNLQVLGTTTTTSTSDVTAGAPFYRANEGDAIGEAGTTFSGTGLDDAFFAGHFTGTTPTTYYVKIDSVGTPDTFAVSTDDFATTISTGNAITGNEQLIHSADNISVTFGATTGHTLNDKWTGTASPILVDSGFFTNRNTGTSGVGYTHMGFFYDVSEDKWVLLDEYDPTPEGAINLAHSSTSYATLKVGSVEGNLTGDVTGDVTGNASTADSLSTSRTIGGVAFNGTANIDLPGVNTTGNQDTTGNAATATALETARTIQLTGDVTGSATFDGSANATITAVVQDDSHSHVISNVDGLQAALDGKADDSTTITAGNGLTGGGSLGLNRTLNVGAGSGISVTADAVAHADTSTQASVNNSGNTFIQDVTLDGFGHVTGLTSSTVTVGDATITVASGGGLTGSGDFTTNQGTNETITLSHADTSSQASVNNSGGNVIQDITLDGYGHITSVGSVNLDGRYYTESEADSRFVNVTGDTMTGTLTLGSSGYADQLTVNRSDGNYYSVIKYTNSNGELGRMGFTETGVLHYRVGLSGTNQNIFHDSYHPNADKWTTARTLSLSGQASGSVSWDGSANATLSVTLNDSALDDQYVTVGSRYTGNASSLVQPSKASIRLWDVSTATDDPSGSNDGLILSAGWDSVSWGVQQYHDFHNNDLYLRSKQNGTFSGWEKVWSEGNDGSGSGLDADTVDGLQASSFLRSDADDTLTGNLQINSHVINMDLNNIADNAIDMREVRSSTWPFVFLTNAVGNDNQSGFWVNSNGYPDMRLRRENGTVRVKISSWETSYVSNGFSISGGTLDMNNNNIVDVEDIGLQDRIYHDGDTDTYMQFNAADTWRVVTGNIERLKVNNAAVVFNENGNANQDFRIEGGGNDHLFFVDAGTDRVGIRESAPETVLHVRGGTGSNNSTLPSDTVALFENSDNAIITVRSPTDAGHYSGLAVADNNIGGYVVHGDGGNGDRLILKGYSGVQIRYGTNNSVFPPNHTLIADFTSSGLSVTSVTETSSIAYKENIEPLQGALGIIEKLNPVTYDRTDNGKKNEAGLIAEEVFKVLPNLVETKDGKPESIAYTKLTAYLLDAVKTLGKEVEQLRETIKNG